MSPLDRIAQLSAEISRLQDENMILRSQLHDGQEQAKRDSETIARLAKDKEELVFALKNSHEICKSRGRDLGLDEKGPVLERAAELLSRHA